MNHQDMPAFFVALNKLAALCCDEMSEERQAQYWELLQDLATLEEWQYACRQSMLDQPFHKVPMPVILLEFVRQFRQLRREHQQQSHRKLVPETQLLQEEVRQLIASVWPEDNLKDPIPPYDQEAP